MTAPLTKQCNEVGCFIWIPSTDYYCAAHKALSSAPSLNPAKCPAGGCTLNVALGRPWCVNHMCSTVACANIKQEGWDGCYMHGQQIQQPLDPPSAALLPQMGTPVHDPVNHPSHYTAGKFETIEVIEDWGLDFHLGNAVKYISRAGKKGDELEDLKKARWYLDRRIAQMEES